MHRRIYPRTIGVKCRNVRARPLWEYYWDNVDTLSEKFPGLGIALSQRKDFYARQGLEVPDMDGLDTRRLIYGLVDLRLGIVRRGGRSDNQPRATIQPMPTRPHEGSFLRCEAGPGLLATQTIVRSPRTAARLT